MPWHEVDLFSIVVKDGLDAPAFRATVDAASVWRRRFVKVTQKHERRHGKNDDEDGWRL